MELRGSEYAIKTFRQVQIMADIFYKNFVAALSADTVGGSEKIAVVDGSTTKYQTPDLIKAYIIAALTASGAVTPH